MKRGKLLIALLLAVVLVFSLTACSSSTSSEETASASSDTSEAKESETAEATEATAKEERTEITIVTAGSRLPYSLFEGENWEGVTADYEKWDEEWSGVESEMWKEIISRTGWKLNLIQTDFASVFGELDSGRVDLAANYYSVNDERLEKYYASVPWASDPQVVIVDPDRTDINTFEDLRGCSIAVTAGQASQTLVDEVKDDYDWEVVTYEGINGYEDVLYGRVDALAGSATTVAEVCETNGYSYHYLDEQLEGGNVVYFVPKTEEGEDLLADLDPVIEGMLDDGTVSEILIKYLYEDMTEFIK